MAVSLLLTSMAAPSASLAQGALAFDCILAVAILVLAPKQLPSHASSPQPTAGSLKRRYLSAMVVLVIQLSVIPPVGFYLAWIMDGRYRAPRWLRWFEERLQTGQQNWKQ